MKVKKYNSTDEKRILTGMIVDDAVLGRISSKYEKKLFTSKWANQVAAWCVGYYQKYNKAPGTAIQGLFESWAAKKEQDPEVVSLVEKFLETISDEYTEPLAADYVLDQAGEHFNKNRLANLVDELQGDIDLGEINNAIARVSAFTRVDLGVGTGIDVLRDKEAIRSAFEKTSEPLIEYPGALGKFFNWALERDSFIAIQAAEKRGKSYWLLDFAWMAMKQQRKVAYFVVGDMSEWQVLKYRLMPRAARHPVRLYNGFPGIVKVPIDISRKKKEVVVDYEERHFKKPLDWRTAWAEVSKRTGELKLSCHPSLSVSILDIAGIIRSWELTGWVPDVIVIDYADNLAPIAGIKEYRHQVNETWKRMRALSQSLHCLLITATQSDAKSYNQPLQTRDNFTEDKRKYAETTAMFALNQTDQEKQLGVHRNNWLAVREGEYYESKVVYVAECRALAAIAVKSTF